MRTGFAQQLSINITPIKEVLIPLEKRDHMANLLAALQHLYLNQKWSQKVEVILGKVINNLGASLPTPLDRSNPLIILV